MNLKKILLGTVACSMVLGLCTGEALAVPKKVEHHANYEPAVYAALRGGLDMMRHKGQKDTWVGAAAVGMDYRDIRTELEFSYHGEVKKARDGVDTKLKSQSYMFNVFYDIPVTTHIKPFVQAGAGLSHIKKTENGSSNRFSWSVGGGVAYEMTENWAIDVGYRYLDIGASVRSNEIYGGLRYSF